MTDEEFRHELANLCDRYETSHENTKILGVYVEFGGLLYWEWTGEKMVENPEISIQCANQSTL